MTRTLGEAYLQQGDYTEALKEFLKAEKLYSNDHLLHNDLGLAYMAKQHYDEAEFHFKKAISIRPEYAPAKNNLGTVYMAKQEWDAAIEQFKTVAGDLLYGTPHFPLANMGIAYYNKQDYTNAEKYYLEALDLEPNFVLALRNLGITYIAMNKLPQAVATLEKAVTTRARVSKHLSGSGQRLPHVRGYPDGFARLSESHIPVTQHTRCRNGANRDFENRKPQIK